MGLGLLLGCSCWRYRSHLILQSLNYRYLFGIAELSLGPLDWAKYRAYASVRLATCE